MKKPFWIVLFLFVTFSQCTRYIVRYHKNAEPESIERVRNRVTSLSGIVESLLDSPWMIMDIWDIDESVANAIQSLKAGCIFSIEEDKKVSLGPVINHLNLPKISAMRNSTYAGEQEFPTYNLDRIDQFELPLDHLYRWDYDGDGVNVYVLDTGINTELSDFENRATNVFSSFDDFTDCNGHGTHVAGIVGSREYGVAKEVNIYSIRILDCEGHGSFSDILRGLNWVADHHIKPAIVQMSLGGEKSNILDGVINELYHMGIPIIAAAGNSYTDACTVAPANNPQVMTVGATNEIDSFAPFSNWGPCVNIFAPGVSIASLATESSYFAVKSGTSMAAPHVTGVAAQILQAHPDWSVAQVYDEIYRLSSRLYGDMRDSNPILIRAVHSEDPMYEPKRPVGGSMPMQDQSDAFSSSLGSWGLFVSALLLMCI